MYMQACVAVITSKCGLGQVLILLRTEARHLYGQTASVFSWDASVWSELTTRFAIWIV